jgi:hypothetical protein
MKKIIYPIMIVAIIVGFYEQTKTKPNIFILIVAIVVFMYGMMRLSAKTLHHGIEEKQEGTIEEEQDDDQRR